MRYSVVVTTEDGGSASVYSRYVDPRNARYERRWLGGIVDLGAYGGQTVEITFEALPGARDGAPGTWCGWGTPVLVDDTPADVADGR